MTACGKEGYAILDSGIWRDSDYNISSIHMEDAESIRLWRNDQMDALRQCKKISEIEQREYFEKNVVSEFNSKAPKQVLFRFCMQNSLIGYGGLVHLNWENKRGEVSFLLETSRTSNVSKYCDEFAIFLSLLKFVAFEHLHLHKLSTEAYAHRIHHVDTIEKTGFTRDGILRDQTSIGGKWVDAIIASCLSEEYFQQSE